MDNLQFMIAQGSTPRIELALPFEADGDTDVVYVTFNQDDKNVLEYSMNGTATAAIAGAGTLAVSDEDDSVLVLTMTQADTLRLTPDDVELQVRIKTDAGADTFFPLVGAVVKSYKTGVIA